MRAFLLTLMIGAAFGTIDILPMLKMKLDRYSILSAFIFYLIAPFIIYNTNLFGTLGWYKGSAVMLLLAMPVIILVARDGIKTAVPIIAMSLILGTLIGVAGRFLIK